MRTLRITVILALGLALGQALSDEGEAPANDTAPASAAR